jgi:predicted Zn-dependent protease
VIAACALALLLAPLLSTTSPTIASDTPSSFHWGRKQSHFTVQAGNNVDGDWRSLLRTAISDWNKSDTVTIKEVDGDTNPQSCNPTKGKIEVCNWNYGTQDGWLGLTRLFFDNAGKHVESATVQMNDSFFNQKNGQYNNNNARRHTICHEMGHAIGLDHVGTKSCLNHSQSAVFNNVKPINKDYRQLERIYKHKDSTTTVAGKQKKEKDKKDRKDKKGKKDKKDKKGKKNKDKKQDDKKSRKERKRERRKRDRKESRSESFFDPTSLPSVPSGLEIDETEIVQTLDDGSKVVTFITWADEE